MNEAANDTPGLVRLSEGLGAGAEARHCLICDDGDGHCAYPYFGAAPHTCYYMTGEPLGASKELPPEQWPANFVLDPDAGPWTGYPRSGTYTHCLHCGAPNVM